MLTSLFYSKGSNAISITIAILLLAGGTFALIQYSENSRNNGKEKALSDKEAEARQLAREKEIAIRRAEEIRLKEEALAKLKARKAAEQAKAAADKKRAQEELAKAAKEKAEAIAEKLRQKSERDTATARFIGTKYPELEIAGKTYKDVTITKANEVGVSFTYEHGARRFKYPELPEEIQQLCKYCPKAAEEFLEDKSKKSAARAATASASKMYRSEKKSSIKTSPQKNSEQSNLRAT